MKQILIGSCFALFATGLMAAGQAPKAKGTKPAAPAQTPAPAQTTAPAQQQHADHAGQQHSMAAHAAPAGGKYGMAGCGLGALVIDRDEMLPQIGASILNGIYSNQTYGITSGTSNCVENRTEVAAMEQEVYFTANLNSISKEAAQGSGEHIEALAEVFGCHADADKSRLGQLSQDHYSELFAQPEPEVVLQRYLTVVNADPQLAKSCTKAG